MKRLYSVEIDRYNPMALAHTLKKMADVIPDFEYDWKVSANGGGIDYGLYLNIDIELKEIEISNQPEYGTDGDDDLYEMLDQFDFEEDET